MTLRILLDRSSIEVFANGGERVLTEQIFPAESGHGLVAYVRGGTASVTAIDIWELALC